MLIVGLGNILFGDDGVGVHAVRYFQNSVPRTCLTVEVGTALSRAIPLFESFDRILAFDAFMGGGIPGSVHVFRAEEMLKNDRSGSLQETELLRLLEAVANMPAEVTIITAEPQRIEWGIELSPAVQAAVPVMVREACTTIAGWRRMDRFDSRDPRFEIAGMRISNLSSRIA